MTKKFLPYARPCINDDDVKAIIDVMGSGWLTTGPAVATFEAAFARYTGSQDAISCSSGTAALHLSLASLGTGVGDSVVVPSITFVAAANMARLLGAEVVFSDVNPATGMMEAHHLEDAIKRASQPVKAVLPVHFAGQAANLEDLHRVCQSEGAELIEDACHAFGAVYTDSDGNSQKIGNGKYAKCAAFSFHPVKPIATGEGGMITTNDPEIAERLRSLRSHGLVHDAARLQNTALGFSEDGEKNPWYYELPEPGWNYRLSDIHCALGTAQLARADETIMNRRNLSALYDERLADSSPVIKPLGGAQQSGSSRHLYVVDIDFGAINMSRAAFMNRLHQESIGTQVHYIPVHRQPYYANRYQTPDLSGAERYYRGALSLPLFADMTEEDAGRVVSALRAIVENPG